MSDLRLHHAPRTAAVNDEPSDLLIPALAQLRACATSLDVLILMDTLPDGIMPGLAWAASRKRHIPAFAIKALVTACGAAHLELGLGRVRARELTSTYSSRGATH
ncbi:hypothetical protein [Tardiphaga sp. vice278]|uniref:hypothetical protein n=1 Tax=Tardiphaga sp. vice278 TaxID=2592815 RepID=UPI001161FB5E|nr:hypothetical protein [Tardiphaga sp. vice278]QDM17554.1 hypothetical protein FNL53_17600 [Tardiphaga sp. vice278]